jgi:hypothetical protein
LAGVLTDLVVAGRLASRAIVRRWHSGGAAPPDTGTFRRQMSALTEAAPAGTIRDVHWLELPANTPPWVASGLFLEQGDALSWFCEGRAYANRFLDIYVPPSVQVWGKIGDEGTVFRGTRGSHTFSAERAGELLLGNYFPNDWADSRGSRKQDDSVYRQMAGGILVCIVRWAVTPLEGLRRLLVAGDPGGAISGEIERLEQGNPAPADWQYLWHLGPAEIFSETWDADGKACMHCSTRGDVGILQKAVDLELSPATELHWRWCVEQLPSSIREDSVPTHDYLSIAVEFDNGRDITYHWSAELAPGTGYDCPLPNWRGKEYHVVVRSGSEQLGRWLEEERNLYADYQRYMGDPPGRIVRVWFIANSVFQRGQGECRYANVSLRNESETVPVL